MTDSHDLQTSLPSPELASQEIYLHGTQQELPMTPLIEKSAALDKYGINGDILARVSLPVPEGAEARDIGVVDYGEFDETTAPYHFVVDGQPIPMFGRPKSRYGLVALSYTPSEHMASQVPLFEDEATTIGRNSGDASYKLGLNEDRAGHAEISRSHATFTVRGDTISISDHSTNGTNIEIPATEAIKEQSAPSLESHAALSGLARRLVNRP